MDSSLAGESRKARLLRRGGRVKGGVTAYNRRRTVDGRTEDLYQTPNAFTRRSQSPQRNSRAEAGLRDLGGLGVKCRSLRRLVLTTRSAQRGDGAASSHARGESDGCPLGRLMNNGHAERVARSRHAAEGERSRQPAGAEARSVRYRLARPAFTGLQVKAGFRLSLAQSRR